MPVGLVNLPAVSGPIGLWANRISVLVDPFSSFFPLSPLLKNQAFLLSHLRELHVFIKTSLHSTYL